MNIYTTSLFLVFFTIFNPTAQAADFPNNVPAQVRLFLGSTKVNPSELNTELTAQSIKNVDLNNKFGIEITFPVKFVNLGLRYSKFLISQDEVNGNPATDYTAQIDQDSILAVARVPLYKTENIIFDVFGGFGGINTTYKLKTASQNGQLTKKDDSGWYATPYTSYGASLALGYKKFYFLLEAGMDNNKINGFTSTGTINSVNEINLSGSYFLIGLMFDGAAVTGK